MRLYHYVCRNVGHLGSSLIDVSLDSPISTIVGPCGSGKTSLLRSIQGFFILMQNFAHSGNNAAATEAVKKLMADGFVQMRDSPSFGFMFLQSDSAIVAAGAAPPPHQPNQQYMHMIGFHRVSNTDTWSDVWFINKDFVDVKAQIVKMKDYLGIELSNNPDPTKQYYVFRPKAAHKTLLNYSASADQHVRNTIGSFLNTLIVVPQDHGLRNASDVINNPSWSLTQSSIADISLSDESKSFLNNLTHLSMLHNAKVGDANAFYKLNGVPIGSFKNLSAGETDALFCISALLGFSRNGVAQQVNLILLDEPGQNLGAHQRSLFRRKIQVISESNPNLQIIMITHHVEMLYPPTLPKGILRFDVIPGQRFRNKMQFQIKVKSFPDGPNEMKHYYQRLDHLELYFARGVVLVEGKNDVFSLYALDMVAQILSQNAIQQQSQNNNQLMDAVKKLCGDVYDGLNWKVISADGCANIRWKAYLCELLRIDYMCVYDFDYLCNCVPGRTLGTKVGDKLGGHALISLHLASFKLHDKNNIKGTDFEWTDDSGVPVDPLPPIMHFGTATLFIITFYLLHKYLSSKLEWVVEQQPNQWNVVDNYHSELEDVYRQMVQLLYKQYVCIKVNHGKTTKELRNSISSRDVINQIKPVILATYHKHGIRLPGAQNNIIRWSLICHTIWSVTSVKNTLHIYNVFTDGKFDQLDDLRKQLGQNGATINDPNDHLAHIEQTLILLPKLFTVQVNGNIISYDSNTIPSCALHNPPLNNCAVGVHRSDLAAAVIFRLFKSIFALCHLYDLGTVDGKRLSDRYTSGYIHLLYYLSTTAEVNPGVDEEKGSTLLHSLVRYDAKSANDVLLGMQDMSLHGCGQPDCIIWSPQVADNEGLYIDKSTVVCETAPQRLPANATPDDRNQHQYNRALYLAWSFGEHQRLVKELEKSKRELDTKAINERIAYFQTQFPHNNVPQWDFEAPRVKAIQALFRLIRYKGAVN